MSTGSCQLVKKLLVSCVSEITFLRSLLPEDCYKKRSLDGLPLLVLSAKSQNAAAQALVNCLSGVFEALEKKYLKELLLVSLSEPLTSG
jgi:hypothetical protein